MVESNPQKEVLRVEVALGITHGCEAAIRTGSILSLYEDSTLHCNESNTKSYKVLYNKHNAYLACHSESQRRHLWKYRRFCSFVYTSSPEFDMSATHLASPSGEPSS